MLLERCHYVIIVIETVGWVRNDATQSGVVEECGECKRTTRDGAPNATNSDDFVTVTVTVTVTAQ